MFLYISKALKGDGKEQKEKPIIISTWAMGEVWYQEGPHRNGGKQIRVVPSWRLSLIIRIWKGDAK